MSRNLIRKPHLILFGCAVAAAISTAPTSAKAQTSVDCATSLASFYSAAHGIRVTGTIVGKSTGSYSMVQITADPNFNPNTWNPASTGAPPFYISSYPSYMRGQFQVVQTYSSGPGNQGWSGQEDLWINRSGGVYSRSITWNSSWTAWRDVRCYSAPNSGYHTGTSDPLRRLIIQGWNPYSGSFVTLDLVEEELY